MTNAYRYDIKEGIVCLLLGLFSPLLAIPFIFLSIYKKNLFSIYVLAFILTVLIGLMPPYADNYHYYLIYKNATDFHISNWLYSQQDFLFYLLAYIFNSLGFQYVSFRLILLFIEMFIFAWIFADWTKVNIAYLGKNKFFYFIFICFLCIDIIFIGFFIRYALMASFLVLSIYLFYKSKYVSGFLCFFIALSSHFGAFLFVPCVLLTFIFRTGFSVLSKTIITILVLTIGTFLFHLIYAILPDILKAETYVTGTWSGFATKSFNGMMFYILQYYVITALCIFTYLFTKIENNYLTRFAFFSILLFCCICSFSELSQRVWWIAKFFVVFSLLLAIIKSKFKRHILIKFYFVMAILISSQLMSLYGFREEIFDKENIYHAINLSSFIFGEPYDDAYFFKRSIDR